MNKKVGVLVLLVFLVSVMAVGVSAKDCGEITADKAVELKAECTYKYGTKKFTLDKDGKYKETEFKTKKVFLTKEGHVYPEVERGTGDAVPVITNNGNVQQIRMYGDMKPSSSKPGSGVGAGGTGKNNEVIRINGERVVVDRLITKNHADLIGQCADGKVKCEIKGKKATIGDRTLIVVGDGKIMERSPEGVKIGGQEVSNLPDDALKLLEAGTARVQGEGTDLQITYQSGEKQQTTFQNRGGYWVKEDRLESGEKRQTFFVGNEEVQVNPNDKTATYGGKKYSSYKEDGGALVLEDDGKTVTFKDGTITEKDGKVSTETKVNTDGTKTVTVKEDGTVTGRRVVSKDGTLISEQKGATAAPIFYDDKGNVKGFGARSDSVKDPKYLWKPGLEGCSGNTDDPGCYLKWNGAKTDPEALAKREKAVATATAARKTASDLTTKRNQLTQEITRQEETIKNIKGSEVGKFYESHVKGSEDSSWSDIEKKLPSTLNSAEIQRLQAIHAKLKEKKELDAQVEEAQEAARKAEEEVPEEGDYKELNPNEADTKKDLAAIEEAAENGWLVGLSDRQELYGETQFTDGLKNKELAGFIGSINTISTLPLMNEFDAYNEWIEDVDRYFAANWLGTEHFVSGICSEWFDPVETGRDNGVAMIQTVGGQYQAAAHIEGQKRPAGPLLCGENEEGEPTCPDNLECREDGLCYDPQTNEYKEGFQYLISFGVRAPYDDEFIKEGRVQGKDGKMVSFNIEIRETKGQPSGKYLFETDSGTGKNAIILEKGASSESIIPPTIVDYSSQNINEVCIVWGNSPKTLDTGFFGAGGGGLDATKEIDEVCNDVIPGAEIKTRSEVVSSSARPTGQGEVRFCTFSGCQ